jgi:perosamine synthetase
MTKSLDIDQIVVRIRSVVGPEAALLHQPLFGGKESQYVQQCIDTGWVSSAGSFVTRLEEQLCRFTGARHAVAVVNGTAALHIGLMLAGVEPDSEVLMPSLTFVATANAAAYCGAIPHFCDVSLKTLGIDAGRLDEHLSLTCELRPEGCINHRTRRRIAALVPMHTFGHPVNLKKLLEVAAKWRLPVVEDAAESLGSYYHDKHTGTFGLLGILSFNGNKTVTTGAGGAILTDDDALARRARHITSTAKVPHAWEYVHDVVGYNYRMPNLNAALGCAQLERLPELLDRKRRLAQSYAQALAGFSGVSLFVEPPDCRSNYWLNALILDCADARLRDALLAALNDAGLQSRPVWRPMHQLPIYRECPRMTLSVSEDLAARIVNIPSSPGLAKATGADEDRR